MVRDRRPRGEALTPLELEIMQALWSGGPASVAEVRARLGGELAHTTVQTMLTVLLRKKKVTRRGEGRGHVYQAAVTRERAAQGALADLVGRMFDGSAEALLMTLIDARQIDADDLQKAARLLAEREAMPGQEAGE